MREKRKKKEIRRSLNRKTFFITMLLTFGTGLTVLVAGFLLYCMAVVHEYQASTWNQANAEAAVIDQIEYKSICDEMLDVYDSISEEERGDGYSEEYLDKFNHFRSDPRFTRILDAMRCLQKRNGPLNSLVVALDRKTGRMIYLVDADQRVKSTCRPGTFDYYTDRVLNILINGRELTKLEENAGIRSRMQSVLTNRAPYGLRVTATATLYEYNGYVVSVCVDEKLDSVISISKVFLAVYVILMLGGVLIASFIGMRLMRKATVIPVNRMAKAAEAYGSDKEKKEGARHFNHLDIHTGDELELLADALSGMEEDISEYIEVHTKETADKERLATELSLAGKIQKSMLIEQFPPFPDMTGFDIFASMEPAKEVGGDFYDMVILDDDHLMIEIADVSGKGIPASLFMMASKIVIANFTRESLSPSEILEKANNRICAGNDLEMFVTVWLGILELSTGILKTANAGHEYPVIVHADGNAELIHDKHGFVVGGMSGMKYTEHEIVMEKGDKIFVYTDGVTEAVDSSLEMFGTERLLDAANEAETGADPQTFIHSIRKVIAGFTGSAEQFDDLTMLCMEYRGEDDQ